MVKRRFTTPKAFASSREDDQQEEHQIAKEMVQDDDFVVNASDDEEISEDYAFDDEDEERYGKHFQNSDGESAPSDFEDNEDAIDLDAMLDDDSVISQKSLALQAQEPLQQSEVDEDLSAEESEEQFTSEVSDEYSETEVVELSQVIQKLDEFDNGKPAKKRFKNEQTEAYDENEFNTRTRGEELTLDQLLHGEDAQPLSQDLKVLDAPLPPLQQQKHARIEAYKQSSQQVSKWTPIIQSNRQQDHLEFPLKGSKGGDGDIARSGSSTLVKTFKPQSELEVKIAQLLESQAQSSDFITVDEPTKQQIQQERQKLRSKQFYEEIKRKRSSKIKSKRFHRQLKKEAKWADKKNAQK